MITCLPDISGTAVSAGVAASGSALETPAELAFFCWSETLYEFNKFPLSALSERHI